MADIKKGDHRFFIEEQGETVAEINFIPSEAGQLIVDHTHVSDKLRGQGIGEALVKRMVEFARQEKKTIVPSCPFVKAQLDQHAEYQDVLGK